MGQMLWGFWLPISLSLSCAFTRSVTLCIQVALLLWLRAHSTRRPLSIPAFLCDTALLDTTLADCITCAELQESQGLILYDLIRLISLPFLAHEVILSPASEWRQGILKWQKPLLFTITRSQPRLMMGDLLIYPCCAKGDGDAHLWYPKDCTRHSQENGP